MKPQITFESWVAMGDERLLAEKERKRMSMPWRIWELAIAKMNNYGHAPFHPGELARLACEGNPSRSDVQAVRRGMKILAAMGRIAPVGENGSTTLCIMVCPEVAQRAAGKGNYKFLCSEPSHMDIRQTPYRPDAWAMPETAETAERVKLDDPDYDPWGDE